MRGCGGWCLDKQAIASFFRDRHGSGSRSTLALRDYWPYWRSQLEDASAGKLVPCWGEEGAGPHVMVFDDNIFHDDAHIIDLRDASSGAPWPFKLEEAPPAINRHLVRVEPYYAITDPRHYFTRELERCLSAPGPSDRSLEP